MSTHSSRCLLSCGALPVPGSGGLRSEVLTGAPDAPTPRPRHVSREQSGVTRSLIRNSSSHSAPTESSQANTGGGIRTHTVVTHERVLSLQAGPRSDRRKSDAGKDHRPESIHKPTPFDPDLSHDTCKTDPDLARVVDAWLTLPGTVCSGIA
jgi:hypothetical protein